jgi:hypothetical protein
VFANNAKVLIAPLSETPVQSIIGHTHTLTAAFFDFVQNLTDFMQAISRAQRLVSPVFRR